MLYRFAFALALVASAFSGQPAYAQPVCAFQTDLRSAEITSTSPAGNSFGFIVTDAAKFLNHVSVGVKPQSCAAGKAFTVAVDDNTPSQPTKLASQYDVTFAKTSPFHIVTVTVTDGTQDIGSHRYFLYAFSGFNLVNVASAGDTDIFTWTQNGSDRTLQIALHRAARQRETADFALKVGPDKGQQVMLSGSGTASAALRATEARLFGGPAIKSVTINASACPYFASTSAAPADAALGSTSIKITQITTDCNGVGTRVQFSLAGLSGLAVPLNGTLSWSNGLAAVRFSAQVVPIGSGVRLANVMGDLLGTTLAVRADLGVPSWGNASATVPLAFSNGSLTIDTSGGPPTLTVSGLNVKVASLACTRGQSQATCKGTVVIDATALQPGFPVLTADFADGMLTNVQAESRPVTVAQLTFDVGQWSANFTNGVRLNASGTIKIPALTQPLVVKNFGFSAPAGGGATLNAEVVYINSASPIVIANGLTLTQLSGSLSTASSDISLALHGSGSISLGDQKTTTFVRADVNDLDFSLNGTSGAVDLAGLRNAQLSNLAGKVAGHDIDVLSCSSQSASLLDPNAIEICVRLHLLPTAGGSVGGGDDALDTRIDFRASDRAFEGAAIHYNGDDKATKHLRLGSISLDLKSADLLIVSKPRDEDFGTGHVCSANFIGQASLTTPTISTTSNNGPQNISIQPEIAIGESCYVFVSEGIFGLQLSPQAGATITHIEVSHTMSTTFATKSEDHLALAGLLHSGNITAVIQKAGFDRAPRADGKQDFSMVFQIDKKTTLALNAVNNADAIIRDASAGIGALFGFLIKK